MMTVRDILTEVSKLTPAERDELDRLWQQAFAVEAYQRRLSALRVEIEHGLNQIQAGDYSEITDRTLGEIEAEALHDAPPRRDES